LREQIAYLKYAQGSTSDDPSYLQIFALLGIVVLSLAILALHRQIERCIEQIGRL